MDPVELSVDRDALEKYFYVGWKYVVIVLSIVTVGMMLGVFALLGLILGFDIHRRQAQAVRYRIDDENLYAEMGVYFVVRRTIPLESILNLTLQQGPLLRRFNLWILRVQTAAVGPNQGPDTMLIGLSDPTAVEKQLLEARLRNRQRSRE